MKEIEIFMVAYHMQNLLGTVHIAKLLQTNELMDDTMLMLFKDLKLVIRCSFEEPFSSCER
jgi:hypothetical protein